MKHAGEGAKKGKGCEVRRGEEEERVGGKKGQSRIRKVKHAIGGTKKGEKCEVRRGSR